MGKQNQNFYFLMPKLIGKNAVNFTFTVGAISSFILISILKAFIPPLYMSEYLKQIIRIGWASLPVVGLTAFFTGGALALQIYLGSEQSMPGTVLYSSQNAKTPFTVFKYKENTGYALLNNAQSWHGTEHKLVGDAIRKSIYIRYARI